MKKVWFKRKCYGWGWYPATKEGWFVMLGFLALAILISLIPKQETLTDYLYKFLIPLLLLVAILIVICYKKGETPRWQWGC